MCAKAVYLEISTSKKICCEKEALWKGSCFDKAAFLKKTVAAEYWYSGKLAASKKQLFGKSSCTKKCLFVEKWLCWTSSLSSKKVAVLKK